MRRIVFFAIVCAFVALPVRAELILNGSFESGSFTADNPGPPSENFMTLSVGPSAITDWTVVTHEIGWIQEPNPFGLLASDGSFLLDLTGHSTTEFGGVSQTITTTPSQNYTLFVDLGVRLGTGPIKVRASVGPTTFEDFTHTHTGAVPDNQWQTFDFGFVADSTGSTLVTITGLSAGSGQLIGVDNVSVVPVPAAVILGILGVAVAGVKLRKFV